MKVRFDEHSFWDFSLTVYDRSGIAEACIALQDRHGVDVNVLLFCAWFGVSGRGNLTGDDLTEMLRAVEEWNREVVCRLRAARRWMKQGGGSIDASTADALRRMIVALEVDCEHAEQLALARAVTRQPADLATDLRAEAVVDNFAQYFERMGVVAQDTDIADLAAIAGAAMPELGREEFRQKLASPGGQRRRP